MRKRRGDADMTEGNICKLLLEFAVPMMIGLLFQQLYNTVDTIVVGRFVGKEALAAVGSTSSIINTMVGLCAGLATGGSVIISQCYGAHEYGKLRHAVHTTIALALILCAVATPVGILIVKPMLQLMATPSDVLPQAQLYLRVYFSGIAGLIMYNMGAGILRAVGDSRRPLYFLCITAVVNTVLDLVFVIKLRLGIAGVAYATIISQFLSAVLVLWSLSHTDAPYGIRWKKLRLDVGMAKRILSVGLPSGLQQALTSFSNVFVQSYINAFGSACMAGWSSYNKLDVFLLIPVQSIALASTTFVGQNYGAQKLSRARDGVRQALFISLGVTAALSVLLIICDIPLLQMFTTDADVIAYGTRFITLISPFYVLICFNQIYAGALRGIGNAKTPMIIMLSSFVVFRQIYLLVNKLLGGAFVPVALAYPMGWVVCSVLMITFYRRSALCRSSKATECPADAQE